MKKISQVKKSRTTNLKRKRHQKRRIRAAITSGLLERIPVDMRGIVAVNCPRELSLSRNYKETQDFLLSLKQVCVHASKRRGFRPTSDIPISIELSELEHVSVRCAVMLTAEMDRLRRISGNHLYYAGSPKLDRPPIALLRQMGCFDLIQGNPTKKPEEEARLGHRVAFPLISGVKCEDRKFEQLKAELLALSEGNSIFRASFNGLAEAMLNASNHAYLTGIPLKYPVSGKRWWAVAATDTRTNQLKVLVYDQGHGIAQTLPYSGFGEWLFSMSNTVLPGSDHPDGTQMLRALMAARTRTKTSGRGKGFADIQKIVQRTPETVLRIASGHAEVTIESSGATISSSFPSHIGGTLIEWTFQIDPPEAP